LRDIDETVGTLQDKIEPDPGNPKFIHRIIDIGYKFKAPEPDGNNPDS
jgi:DNA-binding response OmpR family regulator